MKPKILCVSRRGLVFLLSVFLFSALAVSLPYAVSVSLDTRVVVALDAGHGGEDGGVVGAKSGVYESKLNLIMSKLVGEYLEGAGYRVVYTRKNEGALSRGLFRKREDMDERVRIINRASPAVAVSLHMNSYPGTSRRGAQSFFYAKSSESELLASSIQAFLNDGFNLPDTGRAYAALSAEKYLFWKVSAPTVIVECGFLSNPVDENNLLSDPYRHELAYAIFRGINAFLTREA